MLLPEIVSPSCLQPPMPPHVLWAMTGQRAAQPCFSPLPQGPEGLLAHSACLINTGGCTDLYFTEKQTSLEQLGDDSKVTPFIRDVVPNSRAPSKGPNCLSRNKKEERAGREKMRECKGPEITIISVERFGLLGVEK